MPMRFTESGAEHGESIVHLDIVLRVPNEVSVDLRADLIVMKAPMLPLIKKHFLLLTDYLRLLYPIPTQIWGRFIP